LGSGVQEIDDIFGETEAEKALIRALLRVVPELTEKEAKRVLSEDISEEEVEQYLPMVKECIPEAEEHGTQDWGGFWNMWELKEGTSKHRTKRRSPYPTRKELSRKVMNSGDQTKRALEKMAIALEEKDNNHSPFLVAGAYKTKDKKVRPVDANDGTGEGPGGRPDWFERSKAREYPQKHTGKYKNYLLPRISAIPRGSRLTPERLERLDVGDWLWEEELAMFQELMINREGAIAFDWKEVGKVHEDVSPPILIKTIEHKAWQEKNFPCPKALVPVVVKMLLERLDRGVLEKCNGPYRNPWFLVAKKVAGTYRLINAAMKMNSVTLRDANLPPSADEISEEFAGCACASLIDFFSGYDQLTLDARSRDLTAFMTPLGLLRMTTPPQGATNSVAQFVRVVMTILEDLFPKIAMPFIDDIGVKGPYTEYDGQLILPGIRRFVFEHLQNLDITLDRVERAGASIGEKSQFCYNGMVIVGFVCGALGRSPSSSGITKILRWERCDSVTEGKAFIGIVVYYRIWIEGFAIIAEPIYRLMRKGVTWDWDDEQKQAMRILQEKLTAAPILCKLHYDPLEGWGMIVLAVDASLDGWGGTLGQYDDKGKKRVARYESGIWNDAERRYDATKRECRGLVKCLQKVRFWLYGVHFILELDANTLVAQLSKAATDLPGALVTRWLAWIQLFDFEVKHVKGTKHTAADGLSRRPWQEGDTEDDEDIDEWLAMELNAVGIVPVGRKIRTKEVVPVQSRDIILRNQTPKTFTGHLDSGIQLLEINNQSLTASGSESATSKNDKIRKSHGKGRGLLHVTAGKTVNDNTNSHASLNDPAVSLDPLDDSYSERYQNIARYLTTLSRPEGMSRAEFRKLSREALNYSVRDRLLWRIASKAYPPRLVVDDQEQREIVIKELHDKIGHAGRESTFCLVASRYYWEGCYDYVRKYVNACKVCQHKSKRRQEEALYPTKAAPLFHCLGIDVVKLPDCKGYDSLVVARDDFSGWVEARPLKNPTSKKIAKFIWEEIVCRHGLFGQLKVDGGSEFKGAVIQELNKLGINRIVISAYNSKGNGMIERGHQPIIQALIALTMGGKKPWVDLLPYVLFADRVTVHGPTGFTPFYMVYGREAVLPVETRFPTWRTLGWDEVCDRETLLEMRTKQMQMRDEDVEEARMKKDRRRREGKEQFDATHQIRSNPISEKDLVLAYDIKLMDQDKSRNTKLLYRWLGPYRVRYADQLKGYYVLEELDGTALRRTYAGNRLKQFVKRDGFWYSPEDEVDNEYIPANERFKTDAELEKEAVAEYHERNSTQEIEKATGVVVRVPELPESERAKYVSFAEDWEEVSDNGGSS
jgi:RNase H-like domain found in reverse transcriptase/Integrase zinc binding domain